MQKYLKICKSVQKYVKTYEHTLILPMKGFVIVQFRGSGNVF